MRRSQQGDRRAFAVIAGRYDWRLRGLAYALLLDRERMDAVLAVAYLRAWRDIVRLNPKEDIGAWLYRLTYNACIDTLRRSGDRGDGASPPGIAAGLAALSASDRIAIVLVDREGFTPESAARILGVPPEELTTQLDTVRERLAESVPAPVVEPAPEPAPSESADPEPAAAAEPPAADPAPAAGTPADAPTDGTAPTGNGAAAGSGSGPGSNGQDARPDPTGDEARNASRGRGRRARRRARHAAAQRSGEGRGPAADDAASDGP